MLEILLIIYILLIYWCMCPDTSLEIYVKLPLLMFFMVCIILSLAGLAHV